jgi:hypothetical protein
MHHTHTVQPWTKVNGKWVIYGLGNTVAQHDEAVLRGYEGATARFRTADGRFEVTTAEYIATLVTRYAPGRPALLLRISAALNSVDGARRARACSRHSGASPRQ